MGRYEDGIKEDEKSDLLGGSAPEQANASATIMLRAFKTGGEKKFWQKHLELDLQAAGKSGTYASPFALAADYAQVGENDKAFAWLDKSYEAREGQDLTLLNLDPYFKNLHSDPRFAALLRKLGLPE
jgi:hypothetical protein